MHIFLREMMVCPACHGKLQWTIDSTVGSHIEEGVAECRECRSSYPVKKGIGIFLENDADRADLWLQSESNLMRILRDKPDLRQELMEVPIETLNPADQFFRTLVLEEQGLYDEAENVEGISRTGLYTDEYLRCWDSQVNYLLGMLENVSTPVIDLASGRAYLAGKLIRSLPVPVVISDFSPGVMLRNRQWLKSKGLYERASLLVFDARQIPFKDQSVKQMTSNLGLANIRDAGNIFHELRRVISGSFINITVFYEEAGPNREAIEKLELGQMLFKHRLFSSLSQSGFVIQTHNACYSRARPTPVGQVIAGAGIDGLPVQDEKLEWCVLEIS